jgi:hypothetical protein
LEVRRESPLLFGLSCFTFSKADSNHQQTRRETKAAKNRRTPDQTQTPIDKGASQ